MIKTDYYQIRSRLITNTVPAVSTKGSCFASKACVIKQQFSSKNRAKLRSTLILSILTVNLLSTNFAWFLSTIRHFHSQQTKMD